MKKTPMILGALAITTLLAFTSCKGGKNNNEENVTIPDMQATAVAGMQQDTVTFNASDGLEVRGVLYCADTNAPVIVLCHQARFNNYEYAETAPKLVALGFTCLAIDQRSGGDMDGHPNVTYANATAKNLPTGYTNSLPDIAAAVDYAYNRFHKQVILWGSSYSAALTLKVAMDNPNVRAAVGFSPILKFDSGETAADIFKNYHSKPLFVTSTEKEGAPIAKALSHLGDDVLYQYYPETKGTHGSKALWSSDPSNSYYWEEITTWLNAHK
jgi:dienelactone hydrolase